MVERGNHKGRPPGYESGENVDLVAASSESSCTLLNHWMNCELNLDYLAVNQGSLFEQSLNNASSAVTKNGQIDAQQSSEDLLPIMQLDARGFLELNSLYGQESQSLLFQQSDNSMTKNLEERHGFDEPVFVWGSPMDIDQMKLEEVFQVDQSDLVQSPTLAELNSNDEPFFDLEFESHFMKQSFSNKEVSNEKSFEEMKKPAAAAATIGSSQIAISSNEIVKNVNEANFSSTSGAKVNSFCKVIKKENAVAVDVAVEATIQDSQSQNYISSIASTSTNVENSQIENSRVKLATSNKRTVSMPSTSAEAAIKARKERNRSGFSISSISSLSSMSNDDEGFGSQAEEDDEDDDDDSDGGLSSDDEAYSIETTWNKSNTGTITKRLATSSRKSSKSSNRAKKYFWQYNIQSKGPKVGASSRIVLPPQTNDPHILDDARDPVFSPECHLEGVKHAGKARRGDGNDLTPCPRKLCSIGMELNALNGMINDLTPVSDVPFSVRPKSRKEKNKLASRACRLKKKAQHEANKLKLYGLQKEHQLVNTVIKEARDMLRKQVQLKYTVKKAEEATKAECLEVIDRLLNKSASLRVAGCTAEFVNTVLEKVTSGHPTGGLDEI